MSFLDQLNAGVISYLGFCSHRASLQSTVLYFDIKSEKIHLLQQQNTTSTHSIY